MWLNNFLCRLLIIPVRYLFMSTICSISSFVLRSIQLTLSKHSMFFFITFRNNRHFLIPRQCDLFLDSLCGQATESSRTSTGPRTTTLGSTVVDYSEPVRSSLGISAGSKSAFREAAGVNGRPTRSVFIGQRNRNLIHKK